MNWIFSSNYNGLNLPVVGRKKIWGNLSVVFCIFPDTFDNLNYRLYIQSFISITEGNSAQMAERSKPQKEYFYSQNSYQQCYMEKKLMCKIF